jgi:hypothetical protein
VELVSGLDPPVLDRPEAVTVACPGAMAFDAVRVDVQGQAPDVVQAWFVEVA